MIRRLVVVTLTLIACYVQLPLLQADPDAGGLIPASVVERCGLERAWFIQTRVLPMRDETAYLSLHVSVKNSQTISQVTDQYGQTFNFSERHLNVFGEPLGVAGAKQAAEEKARLLKLNGVEATIQTQVVPDIKLYIASSSGVVQAADAESGRILWSRTVGRSDYFTTSLAATDDMVAILNGQQLFVLRPEDGTVLDQRRMVGGVPAAGPAILGMSVFVPTLSGQLHAFKFGTDEPKWPSIYQAKGTARFAPTSVGGYVMWPTDTGTISAIDPKRAGAQFRLQLDDPIAGPLVYSPPRQILTVTQSGYLYSFDAKTGGVMWRYSMGDATAEPASVVNDTVYVVARDVGMRAVDTATGEAKWWAHGAGHFVAATKDKVYATTNTNVFTVLDAQNGKAIAELQLDPKDRAFVNNQTDRIYIGTETGLIQCLHERGAFWPTVHVTGAEMAAAEAAAGEAAKETGSAPADGTAKPTDPFAPGPGGNADPFSGKPAPADEGPAKKEPAPGPEPKTEGNPFETDEGGEAKSSPTAEAEEGDESAPAPQAEEDEESKTAPADEEDAGQQ